MLLTCDKKDKKIRIVYFHLTSATTIIMIIDYSGFKDIPPFSFDSSTPTRTYHGQSSYLKNRENSVDSLIADKNDSGSQSVKEQDQEYRSSLQADQK